jgi:hypothetical protein
MAAFPLIYGFRELVAGNGFVAGVEVNGRLLLRFEEGEWWAHGVEPGGLSAEGSSELEAYRSFRATLREVLVDSAVLTDGFESFKTDVEGLCAQRNDGWEAEWQEAREAVRSGRLAAEGQLAELPRETKEVRCGMSVVRLDNAAAQAVTPSYNANAAVDNLAAAA